MPIGRDLSQLDPLYDKLLKCLFCGQEFKTKKIRSRFIKPVRTETDFYQIYEEGQLNPLHYYVAVCPGCAFAFTEEFTAFISARIRPEVQAELVRWRAGNSKNYCEKRTLPEAIETYTRALKLTELLKEKNITQASLYVRLAWIYRGQSDLANEKRYLQLAADFYEQSFITGDFAGTNLTEVQLLYMLGELRRRLGDYRGAVNNFSKVVQHPDRTRYNKFVNMARDQWKVAVEDYRKMKRAAEEDLDEYEDVVRRKKK